MNEMRKRVAEAICTAEGDGSFRGYEYYAGTADTAIEAMREPTSEMLSAGMQYIVHALDPDIRPESIRELVKRIFQDMIDAAREEEK